MTFPRRFPRTGNLFQVKSLPELDQSYRSDREKPLLMSSDVPYCTVDEQNSGKSNRTHSSKHARCCPVEASISSFPVDLFSYSDFERHQNQA